MHFRTYVGINYFYYLHMRNPFLKLCHVFFKHPVNASLVGGYAWMQLYFTLLCFNLFGFRTLFNYVFSATFRYFIDMETSFFVGSSGVRQVPWYLKFSSLMHFTYPICLILLEFVTIIVLGEEYQL
jgi:hypothetical protein